MKKNVLSIDMDYIMAPCINLYNDLSHGYTENEKIWDMINKVRGIDEHLSYDPKKVQFIFDVFGRSICNIESNENIMFARNHDSILKMLCNKNTVENTYNLYNIDHHHDLFYGPRQIESVVLSDFTSLNNWVLYLDKYGVLDRYTWIKNESSEEPILDECKEAKYELKSEIIYDSIGSRTGILNENFDYIFVCMSPEWLPKKFNYFFDMLLTLASNIRKEKYIVNNDKFCLDDKSAPWLSHPNYRKMNPLIEQM